ncbi:putative Phytocyanin domain, cupredoxin [Helianthus annuus]|uniref:Phytocyanin domain, cupredoxin n=1 Tax=Helianthus annuus TaxID=4232 RepID=A0A251SQ39_HELAN|nr:early nodulin-like protein 1 [Helianthus annuus]KAF5788154.1 putative Phytocyanin domain, cupredoxin [Helianthus annuus]KAJ0515233.1 putative Phytocyanin domain, cupredoxin [Helianthus annuus]KAJ0531425.1 putative Phytocyanin domain, cupredoxin [Helianthus annuus]KAJ0698268.1 putative Phytocyanin domain, cupredoxin [Helianthus annuus]KAJ0959336.1 putative Phytocyanin domain, cupredoxin [Helianthus annuus]
MGSSRFFMLCFIAGLVSFSMNVDAHEPKEFLVGGKENSWRIPTTPNVLNEWAEKQRFKVGDVLVFKYDSKTDSVLIVEEGDYKKCNKMKPIQQYNDGITRIKIVESGAFFFISGANGHCEKGEKLEVKVLSHKHSSPPPSLPPKSSPSMVPPPAQTPAESPNSSAVAPNVRIIGVSTMIMAIWTCFMIVF